MIHSLRWLPMVFAVVAWLVAGCKPAEPQPQPAPEIEIETEAADPREGIRNDVGRSYVRLVLALGEHDADYVDAYYGPPHWREDIRAQPPGLEAIRREAVDLQRRLREAEPPEGEVRRLRHRYLLTLLGALHARATQLDGEVFSFDQEVRALYDVAPAHYSAGDFRPVLKHLDALLPGDGPLHVRYNDYVERFAVPVERLEAVMRAAIDHARRRTRTHIALPDDERFELALVSDKPWSAYNWYQGDYVSRIEINTDLPVTASRVIHLAVHEGYPGHHVYNVLLEKHLVRGRGWPEYQVLPLFSPVAVIAEGTADYGVDVAFPDHERLILLQDVIFPLAGLDPAQAANYHAVTQAARGLGGAAIEAARRYLDGDWDAPQTISWLQEYALNSEARARQRLAFFEAYGGYIVNYSLGERLVADYVGRRLGDTATPRQRWEVLEHLISTPQVPQNLVQQ